MRIDVVGLDDVNVTPEIKDHAEAKGGKLPKYFDGTQQITFTISKPSKLDYRVECLVDVEKHEDFVAKADGPDITPLIDQTTTKAARQLSDFKEKLKTRHR